MLRLDRCEVPRLLIAGRNTAAALQRIMIDLVRSVSMAWRSFEPSVWSPAPHNNDLSRSLITFVDTACSTNRARPGAGAVAL